MLSSEGRRRAVERRPRRSRPARRGRPGTPEAASSEQQQQQQRLLLPRVLLLPSKAAAAAQRPAPGGAGGVVRGFFGWRERSRGKGVKGRANRAVSSCFSLPNSIPTYLCLLPAQGCCCCSLVRVPRG